MSLRRYEAVMNAVGDPTRVRILKLLKCGEFCVCQIIAVLALSPSTVSKHLPQLKSAGLVNDRKEKIRDLSSWLDRDPVIVRDRARLANARKDVGSGAVCAALPCVGVTP